MESLMPIFLLEYSPSPISRGRAIAAVAPAGNVLTVLAPGRR